LSRIDWENRVIIGKSGTIYKVLPEKISVGRWPKYELWGTLLATRMDLETFLKTIDSVTLRIKKSRTLEFGDIIQSYNELDAFRAGIKKYAETGRSQLSEFAALFCFKTDKDGNINEDVGVLTEDMIREKHNDWIEIPHPDFFLFVFKHIPSFQENLRIELEKGED